MEPNYGVPTGGVPRAENLNDFLQAKLSSSELGRTMIYKEAAKPLGVKYDNLKPRWSLVPPGVMAQVVDVLTFGAAKYSSDNWMHVDPEKYYNALHRHVDAWRNGERLDQETGKHHLAHALCCLMFMLWHDDKKTPEKANG